LGLQLQTDCLATEATRIEGQLPEGKLMGFYPHVGELSKVLIEGATAVSSAAAVAASKRRLRRS